MVFANTLEEDAFEWFFEDLFSKCITSFSSFLKIFFEKWREDEGDMESFIKNSLASLPRKEHHMEIHDDIMQIENLVRIEEPIFFTIE